MQHLDELRITNIGRFGHLVTQCLDQLRLFKVEDAAIVAAVGIASPVHDPGMAPTVKGRIIGHLDLDDFISAYAHIINITAKQKTSGGWPGWDRIGRGEESGWEPTGVKVETEGSYLDAGGADATLPQPDATPLPLVVIAR